MTAAPKIVLGWTGQKLRHVPLGVPSSATFELEDTSLAVEDADRVIADGNATAATWTITSTAVAGPTQRNGHRISCASTTGATIGAPALIVAPDGTRQLIEIAKISTNAYVEASARLAGVYPVGSVVYGVLLEADVPDDFAADLERFRQRDAIRVTWTYTINGQRESWPEFVNWVRHSASADAYVGEALLRVRKLYPSILLPDGGDLDAMAPALADDLADDIRALNIDPETFLTGPQGRGLMQARILAHLGDVGWSPGNLPRQEWADKQHERYQAKLDRLTIATPGRATAETDLHDDMSITGTPSTASRPVLLGL